MDVKKLAAFTKAVDLESISRASVSLHLTQSALSQQLSSLEASMGVQLLARSQQGVYPTQAGRILYRHAQQILRSVDEAVSEVRSRGEGVSGRVSVGLAPYSMAGDLTVPLLAAVRDEHPNIVVHVRENFGGLLSELIATGQVDMGVLYAPVSLRAVSVEPVHVDELCLLSHADRGIPAHVEFTDITDLELIVPTRQHSIRLAVDSGFQRHDVFPRIAAEVESVPSLLEAVGRDLGATILPRTCLPDLAGHPDLVVSTIGTPPMSVRVAFCTSASLPLTPQAAAVERILRRLLAARIARIPSSAGRS
ncbi:LysR substrate-binding domain-containing protein [Microbacterium sp. gxy059]|uniref:LysR substrate-binding domain-containing protein n=1 Tax=Microbacterium sp. gxy059 TaxID=2957199 RepID=UPI003D992E4C